MKEIKKTTIEELIFIVNNKHLHSKGDRENAFNELQIRSELYIENNKIKALEEELWNQTHPNNGKKTIDVFFIDNSINITNVLLKQIVNDRFQKSMFGFYSWYDGIIPEDLIVKINTLKDLKMNDPENFRIIDKFPNAGNLSGRFIMPTYSTNSKIFEGRNYNISVLTSAELSSCGDGYFQSPSFVGKALCTILPISLKDGINQSIYQFLVNYISGFYTNKHQPLFLTYVNTYDSIVDYEIEMASLLIMEIQEVLSGLLDQFPFNSDIVIESIDLGCEEIEELLLKNFDLLIEKIEGLNNR